MLLEKQPLTAADMSAEAALELPDRDMMGLITVVIAGVRVDVDADVVAQVCAQVITTDTGLECIIR
jgi:hypothetical protein